MNSIKSENLIHISFETQHAIKSFHTFELEDKHHILHGQSFFSETITPRSKKTGNFGKAKTNFYKDSNSPVFDNINDLLKSLGLDPESFDFK